MLMRHYLHLSPSSPLPIPLHLKSHEPRIKHLKHLKFRGSEIVLRSTGRAMRRRCQHRPSPERVHSRLPQDTRRARVQNLCLTQSPPEEAPNWNLLNAVSSAPKPDGDNFELSIWRKPTCRRRNLHLQVLSRNRLNRLPRLLNFAECRLNKSDHGQETSRRKRDQPRISHARHEVEMRCVQNLKRDQDLFLPQRKRFHFMIRF